MLRDHSIIKCSDAAAATHCLPSTCTPTTGNIPPWVLDRGASPQPKQLPSPFASAPSLAASTPNNVPRVPSPAPLVSTDSAQLSLASASTGPADMGLQASHRDSGEEPEGCSSSDGMPEEPVGAVEEQARGGAVEERSVAESKSESKESPGKTGVSLTQTCVMMVGCMWWEWVDNVCACCSHHMHIHQEWCEMGSLFNAIDAGELPRLLPDASDLVRRWCNVDQTDDMC